MFDEEKVIRRNEAMNTTPFSSRGNAVAGIGSQPVPTPESVHPPASRVSGWLVCVLAFALVIITGVFLNAFAAFLLLPLVIGLGAVQFFRRALRPATAARWTSLLIGNGLILAFLLSLLLLGFETYYRFGCDRTDAMGNTLVSLAWTRRHVQLNSSGFRDNLDYAMPLVPGKPRITVVGDSFTYGYGLRNVDDRFANRIRHLHPEWEIHVVAKPGLDTSTEVDALHVLTVSNGYRLDWVVLVYQINDIGEVMPGWVEGYKKMMADPFRQSWLCENSYFVNLFYHRWQLSQNAYMRKYFDEVEAAYRGPLWETEKLGLLALNNLTKLRGGRLLVVTFPYMDAMLRFQPVHEQLDRYWRERGVPHLDLLPVFTNQSPAKLVVNAHDAHPNEFAHELAAKAIDEFLRREINRDAAEKSPTRGP